MESQLLYILSGVDVVKYWVWSTRQAMELDIQICHLRVRKCVFSQFFLMPADYLGSYQVIPCFRGTGLSLLQERERRREAVLLAEYLHMIGPSSGAGTAHLQDVYDYGVDSGVGIGPDIVEQAKSSQVKNSFNWKFSQEKEECRGGRCVAQL